ncbi:uncharacterized protein J4E78_008924 [Alternaria triticimaculans]|uniref:uncharacterized protein n=1 Tax=Alternaria triticimaculans TaxID=297637 RepID=UPI0020C27CD1|nr:uncharacterized protein J4E78_008924 [Alternaria triticimaculans]KAI4647609.1 hypothetical protein J4E78_008924 [Alternaria triticimaculans]
MSAIDTTPDASGAVTVDSTNTNTPVDAKQEALQKKAAESEAKRIENLAIQRKKLEAAKQKAAQELASKGKNAVLKTQPSRPTRRPVKKNRKPLLPPANRTHEIEATIEKTKASAEEKRLAPLRIVRPSYSYSDIVEQRVVDGVVERIVHTNHPAHESCVAHNHDDGIEQRMADGVTESTLQSADAPETVQSDTDVESDRATEPYTESDEDAPQLVQELASPEQVTVLEDDDDFAEASSVTTLPQIYITAPIGDADEEPSMTEDLAEAVDTSSEPTKVTGAEKSTCSPSAILSMPNSALYPSRLSRDEEAKLVAMHVTPIVLPVAEAKQQKLSKAQKKAAKTSEASKEVATTKSDVVQKLPETGYAQITFDDTEPSVIPDESDHVAILLARPNGSGVTTESRNLHEKLVALHVAPPSLPVTSHKQQKTPTAKSKATKADQKKTVTVEKKEQKFVASFLSKPNGPGETKEARGFHEKLVALHTTLVSLPVTAPKQQKASKKDQKATKAEKKKIVATEKKEPDFIASLLCKPNGSGETKETRDFHNNLVAMHVAPLEVSVSIRQNKDKKAEKANRYIETWTADPDAVDAMFISMVPPITEEPISAVEELSTDDATRDEPSVVIATPNQGFWQTVLSKTPANEATTVEQTVIIPDSAPTTTPPTSSYDDSSSESDTIKSYSSSHSTPSIRRAASKARTTFLGATSLETFITTLDFELWDGTTTKDDICEAFASLAGHPTTTTTSLNTAKIQRKIKLGSTSLYAFLRQITFMEDEVTVVGEVMRVFRKAARSQVTETKLEVALWLAEETDEGSQRGRRSKRASMAGGV